MINNLTVNLKTHIQTNTDNVVEITQHLLNSPIYWFRDLTPSMLPNKVAVVYAIIDASRNEVLYVGRTKNVRQRLYNNHLMGPTSNARLKKYLIEDSEFPGITNVTEAKKYLLRNCYFHYIEEYDTLKRGRLEGLLSYTLDVRYIHEEH